jgi:translation initiation factor IF-1
VQAHSDYDITCLVRNSDKGAQIASQYSRVRLVYGDLDSAELLEEEAQKADIILRKAL